MTPLRSLQIAVVYMVASWALAWTVALKAWAIKLSGVRPEFVLAVLCAIATLNAFVSVALVLIQAQRYEDSKPRVVKKAI